VIPGRPIVAGRASGAALVTDAPLSFWGGYDWKTGEIIDRRHMLSGASARGKILAVPFTRGSSTTTAVLLEAIRAGTAPAALVTTDVDFFFALASVVADELYAAPLPLVALGAGEYARLQTGDDVQVKTDGRLVVHRKTSSF